MKWLKITWKSENWKWPLVSLTSIISASSSPNVKSKDNFEKLRTNRFQNWPSFLNLVKIWGSYSQKTNCVVFCGHGVYTHASSWDEMCWEVFVVCFWLKNELEKSANTSWYQQKNIFQLSLPNYLNDNWIKLKLQIYALYQVILTYEWIQLVRKVELGALM